MLFTDIPRRKMAIFVCFFWFKNQNNFIRISQGVPCRKFIYLDSRSVVKLLFFLETANHTLCWGTVQSTQPVQAENYFSVHRTWAGSLARWRESQRWSHSGQCKRLLSKWVRWTHVVAICMRFPVCVTLSVRSASVLRVGAERHRVTLHSNIPHTQQEAGLFSPSRRVSHITPTAHIRAEYDACPFPSTQMIWNPWKQYFQTSVLLILTWIASDVKSPPKRPIKRQIHPCCLRCAMPDALSPLGLQTGIHKSVTFAPAAFAGASLERALVCRLDRHRDI